jgi:signal peptidase II
MNKKIFVINFIALIVFLLDRLFKYIFLQNPSLRWDFVFFWQLSKNHGIAFNIPIYRPTVIIITIVIIFILVSFLIRAYKKNNYFNIAFLTLIIFGAFSNLLDRLQDGFVVDYIDVPYFTVLNLADIMITVGVALILIKEFFFKNSPNQITNPKFK